MFSIERSLSRSNVKVPASAFSSSKETSPDSSDWVAAKDCSSIVVNCCLQLRLLVEQAFAQLIELLLGNGSLVSAMVRGR